MCFTEFCKSLRILCIRYHLKGVKAGRAEVFVDNLPCLPDNIRFSSSGGYWIACGVIARYDGKFSIFDFSGPRPWIRWIASKVSAIMSVLLAWLKKLSRMSVIYVWWFKILGILGLVDHLQSGVIYNFGAVCLPVFMSVSVRSDDNFQKP